jgi:hypothetical protein
LASNPSDPNENGSSSDNNSDGGNVILRTLMGYSPFVDGFAAL